MCIYIYIFARQALHTVLKIQPTSDAGVASFVIAGRTLMRERLTYASKATMLLPARTLPNRVEAASSEPGREKWALPQKA